MLSDLIRWLMRNRYAVLAMVLLSLFISATLASNLELRSGFADLLPQEMASVKVLKEIPKRVGGPGFLTLSVNGRDGDELQSYAKLLAERLQPLSTVRYVKLKPQIDSDMRNKGWLYAPLSDLERVYGEVQESIAYHQRDKIPFYFALQPPRTLVEIEADLQQVQAIEEQEMGEDRFLGPVGADGERMLAVLVKPAGFPSDIPFCKKLLGEINTVIGQLASEGEGKDLTVRALGAYAFNQHEYQVLKQGILSSAILALLGIGILLMGYFRNWRVLIWVLAPPVVGLLWTFGLTFIFIGYLNTQTAFMAAILLGLVVDASIHLVNQYFIARGKAGELTDVGNRAAIRRAMLGSVRPIGMAVVTTGGAFFLLSFTDFLAFRHFGLIGSMGLILSMVSTYVVFCLLAMFLPISMTDLSSNFWFGLVRRFQFKRAAPTASLAVALGVVLVAVAALNVGQIQFEYDLNKLTTKNPDNEKYMQRLGEIFPRGITPTIVMADSLEEIESIHQTLEKQLENGEINSIDRIESIYSLLPRDQDEKIKIFASIRSLLNKNRNKLNAKYGRNTVRKWLQKLPTARIGLDDLPPDFVAAFSGIDGSKGLFVNVFPKYDLNNGQRLAEHAEEVRMIRTENGSYFSGGEGVIFADMLALMKVDGHRALLLAVVFIVLCLFYFFRNVGWVALALIPIGMGTLLLCGSMVLFDIKLNFFNFVVFPAILGIGVDNGIHMVHRFREDPTAPVSRLVREIGGAVGLSSLTTVIGFATLLISPNQALKSVGLLAVVGVGLCWLCTIVFLPAVLLLVQQHNVKGAHQLKQQSGRY